MNETFDVWVLYYGYTAYSIPYVMQFKACKMTEKSVTVIESGRKVTMRNSSSVSFFKDKETAKNLLVASLKQLKDKLDKQVKEIALELENPHCSVVEHRSFQELNPDFKGKDIEI